MFYATTTAHGAAAYNAKIAAWATHSTRSVASAGLRASQDDTTVTLQVDVPGLSKSELAVGIEGHVVRINSKEGASRSVHFAYELPQEIVVAQSDAKLENGVLTLTLAKQAPASQSVELPIN